MNKCPYYQGVCGLDEDIVCFSDCDACDIFKSQTADNDEDDLLT